MKILSPGIQVELFNPNYLVLSSCSLSSAKNPKNPEIQSTFIFREIQNRFFKFREKSKDPVNIWTDNLSLTTVLTYAFIIFLKE